MLFEQLQSLLKLLLFLQLSLESFQLGVAYDGLVVRVLQILVVARGGRIVLRVTGVSPFPRVVVPHLGAFLRVGLLLVDPLDAVGDVLLQERLACVVIQHFLEIRQTRLPMVLPKLLLITVLAAVHELPNLFTIVVVLSYLAGLQPLEHALQFFLQLEVLFS